MNQRAVGRVQSVDLLRGLVMIIMAIDHVRDFTNFYSQHFQPDDLTHTYPAMFLTRWITHFCAPVFVFLAGTSAFLAGRRRTNGELSRFLLSRGAWLLFAEFTIVCVGMTFDLSWGFMLWQVIWTIGWSMIALAALIYLPWRALLAVSLVVIAGHNLLDPIAPSRFGTFAWLWHVLHGPPTLFEYAPGHLAFDVYPLIPWIFVMSAGYCFGRVFTGFEAGDRRRFLVRLGTVMIVAFIVLRLANGYGNPFPWAAQSTPAMTVLSFLNVMKYPPSLDFLLMTLGPAMLFLAAFDRARVADWNPFAVYGRVPFFYYVCHWYLLHLVAVLLAWFRYGRAGFLRQLMPAFDAAASGVPPDYGYSLAGTYLIWAFVVVTLYPLCLWFSRVKARSNAAVLSYL